MLGHIVDRTTATSAAPHPIHRPPGIRRPHDQEDTIRPVPGEVLSDLGEIRVSDRAAREFAATLPRIGHPPREIEDARDWLARLLADARQIAVADRTGASQWRRRSRGDRLDVEAMVDVGDDHVVVTHVHARHYAPRPRR